jgi:hypothetical protein
MKERAFTLACSLGALLLFVGMFLRREGGLDPRNDIPRPITSERRGNGYDAAMAWLEGEKLRVISLRERFDHLSDVKGLASTGNLLIVTLPAAAPFNTEEFVPLDRWVRAGNTLLVVAALADMPDWAFSSAGIAIGDLNLLTGLEFETVRAREERLRRRRAGGRRDSSEQAAAVPELRAFAEPERDVLVPNRPHAYFNDVSQVVALSDYSSQAWAVKVPYQGFVLSLARQKQTGEGVFWIRPLGDGRIVVSGFGSIFTNRALGLGDNAQLLANIIGANVKAGGAVLFDDAHQGVGAGYDPQKFYQDKRLYITVGVLTALWLIWVVGSTRLRVRVARETVPQEIELVRAAGGFFARVLPAHAAARSLLENFFHRVNERAQRRDVSPQGASPPWEMLERHPRVVRADLEQLKAWHAEALAARRVPLGRLYNLILRIDESIA